MKAPAFLLPVLAAAGGLAIGYGIGHRSGEQSGLEAERTRMTAAREAEAKVSPGRTDKGNRDKGEASNSRLVPPPRGFESLDLQQIMASAGPLDRFQALLAYAQRLPKDQIAPTLKSLQQQMQGRFDAESLFASHMLMTRFGMEDPEGAMKYLKTLDMWGQGFGTATVLATMATKDPQAAAAYFKDKDNLLLSSPMSGGWIAGAVAKEWAKQDPNAAIEWAKSLDPGLRGGALGSIMGSMAVDDPSKAARTVGTLGLAQGDEQNRVYGQIGQAWAARDPEAAFKWIDSLPAGGQRDEAARRALESYANNDPVAAAKRAEQIADEGQHDRAVGAVAGPWSRRDPAAAAKWVSAQGEGRGRDEATRNIMSNWTNSDPTAASTWLLEQPAGSSKDEGIVTLSNQVMGADPEGAVTWAATIGDPMKRGIQLKSTVDNWVRKDEAAARRWVEGSPNLSAEEKTRLIPPKGN